ncbi:ankyrin repeat domain-containing protein [Myxococcus landrumensis]|uniref:Ankyrin repeat domain-containing protein n=1 Tax=Myxococcus landrumensis TaxID=2813577 RepID=A0ABX7MXQ4_9BACT|nr:ankyrin repeat domain-containing protein [Myxococcus landrumus]QSQ11217.1 ankyrin repeat domain-containing protein [Myxococcus landrumus]
MSPKKKLSKRDAALIAAIEKPHARNVAKLLAEGANAHVLSPKGYCPLHLAAAENRPDIATLLLDAGAEVDARDAQSATALNFATAHTDDTAIKLVKLLIARGANVNHRWTQEPGDTVLTDLLNKDNNKAPSLEILRILLEAGADPNATNDRKETPLMLSVDYQQQPELFELLLKHGVEIDAVDNLGRTALMQAIQYASVPIAKHLIAKGANVNHVNTTEEGDTVLTLALNPNELFGEPSPKVLSELLRAGADPNKPNIGGWTPLHLAAHHADEKLVQVLLKGGANPKTGHANGYYPIDTATAHDFSKVVKHLLAAGSPTVEQVSAERILRIWKRIQAWYETHHPPYAEHLANARPATTARVDTLEKGLGMKLPLDLRAFLLRFGGGSKPGLHPMSIAEYDVLSVAQVLDRWKGLRGLVEKGAFKKARPHELPEDQQEVKWTWWHPGWVPLAEDSGGNLYCVDLDPGPRGRRGQVIQWEIHGGPLRLGLDSLEEFFEHYLSKLEKGRVEF